MFPGTGCVIDGSHMHPRDFIIAVIDLAIDSGFEIDMETYRADLEWLEDYRKGNFSDEDKYIDVMDALDWTYDDALDYLNDKAPDNCFYMVEDQSLYLEEEE